MLVIKRKGNIQDLDMDKISASIVNSADDIKFTLTQSDINIVLNQIKKNLAELTKGNRSTSTYEIRGLVYHSLIDNGFKAVVRSYMHLA